LKQPVLSKESKVSCSRKQKEPLMGLKLATDRLPVRCTSHLSSHPLLTPCH